MRCYGYSDSGNDLIAAEAEVIRDCATRVLAGDSITSIVADLRTREVETTAGKLWTHMSLRRLLVNPRLAGLRTHKGEVTGKGDWPAIVDKKTHQRLVAILTDPARGSGKLTNVRRYLLTGGLLVCGGLADRDDPTRPVCGRPLYAQPSNSGKRGYVCRGASPSYGCGRIRIAAESLEDHVRDRVLGRLASPRIRAQLTAAVTVVAADDDALDHQLAALDERLTEAGRLYARGRMSAATIQAVEREVGLERHRLQAARDQLGRIRALPPATPEALADWWLDASLTQRRDIVSTVLDHIVVRPSTRRGHTDLDTDRLQFEWK